MTRGIRDIVRKRSVRFNPNVELFNIPQANTPELFQLPIRSPKRIRATRRASMQTGYNQWTGYPGWAAAPPSNSYEPRGIPLACSTSPYAPPECIGWYTEMHNHPNCSYRTPAQTPDPNPVWRQGLYYPHVTPFLDPPERKTLPEWRPPPPPVTPAQNRPDAYKDAFHYGLVVGSRMTPEQVNDAWRQDLLGRHPKQFWNEHGIPACSY